MSTALQRRRIRFLEAASRPMQNWCKSLAWFHGDRSALDVEFDPALTLDAFYEKFGTKKTDEQLMRDNPGMRIYR